LNRHRLDQHVPHLNSSFVRHKKEDVGLVTGLWHRAICLDPDPGIRGDLVVEQINVTLVYPLDPPWEHSAQGYFFEDYSS